MDETIVIGACRCEIIKEHGREWAVCPQCGAQWALDGSDYEQVSQGDGYCEENESDE